MFTARPRRIAFPYGWLALASTAGAALAADPMPPLRVDPTLLGGTPIKSAPAKPAPPPAAPATPATTPVATQPDTTATDSAEARPVTPPPAVQEIGSVPPVAVPTAPAAAPRQAVATPAPVTAPVRAAAPPAPAPTPVQIEQTAATPVRQPIPQPGPVPQPAPQPVAPVAPAVRIASGAGAQNMQPFRVDPALLGGPALAKKPAAGSETQPPLIAEQPAIAPLFSAHVAAGRIPHPSSTPMTASDKNGAPTLLSARQISGVNDVEMVAEGNAILSRAGDTLSGDRITYRVEFDEVEAVGNVRLAAPDTTITGPRMRMRMEESTGEFESPAYSIRREQKPVPEPALTLTGLPAVTGSGKAIATTGRMITPPPITGSGTAERIEFRGEDQYHLAQATYSTCAPGQRDWEIALDELDLDYNSETGSGRGATVRFLNLPIFYSPWMEFSLNNDRKSGFLPPTIGSSSKSGFEVTAPWYWNIAPDMDATIAPRLMSKRGLQLNTEFRYLLDTAQNRATALNPLVSSNALPDKGQIRVEYLPDDNQANRDRWGYNITHNQTLPTFLPGHTLTANLNLNRVSDDDYYSDMSTRIASVSQGNLLNQGGLTFAGPWYNASVITQYYQTLQDLQKPYSMQPQITATANRYDLPFGMAINVNGSYTSYEHPDLVLVKRSAIYPQVSLPLRTSAFWLTPKVGVHSAHYALDGQDRPGAAAWKNVSDSQSRSVPVFSVDGGVTFERDTRFLDRDLVQTLEPRAFYTYIPRRDQSTIPNIDSGLADFNYASMFYENRYSGNDRIGDANQLTTAVTSRFIDPATGGEIMRALIGTRYYFTDQYDKASLPGEVIRTERSADILAALAGQIMTDVYADTAWQYNPRDSQTERFSMTGRYRPAPGRIINAGYRYARNLTTDTSGKPADLELIDLSAQWPIFGGWSAVGRYNYSLEEKRVVEAIGGLEYNAGCWSARIVGQRLATIDNGNANTAIFFQIELNDFARIGSNPLQLLRRNIPGYGVINNPTADPVFAEN